MSQETHFRRSRKIAYILNKCYCEGWCSHLVALGIELVGKKEDRLASFSWLQKWGSAELSLSGEGKQAGCGPESKLPQLGLVMRVDLVQGRSVFGLRQHDESGHL